MASSVISKLFLLPRYIASVRVERQLIKTTIVVNSRERVKEATIRWTGLKQRTKLHRKHNDMCGKKQC